MEQWPFIFQSPSWHASSFRGFPSLQSLSFSELVCQSQHDPQAEFVPPSIKTLQAYSVSWMWWKEVVSFHQSSSRAFNEISQSTTTTTTDPLPVSKNIGEVGVTSSTIGPGVFVHSDGMLHQKKFGESWKSMDCDLSGRKYGTLLWHENCLCYAGGLTEEETDDIAMIDVDSGGCSKSGLKCENRYKGHALSLDGVIYSFGPQYVPGVGMLAGRFALCMEEVCRERSVMRENCMPGCFSESAAVAVPAQHLLFLLARREAHAVPLLRWTFSRDAREGKWQARAELPHRGHWTLRNKMCSTNKAVFVLAGRQLLCFDLRGDRWRIADTGEDRSGEAFLAWM
jgi:hypothetical protein